MSARIPFAGETPVLHTHLMLSRMAFRTARATLVALCAIASLFAATETTKPFVGITLTKRTETAPRAVTIHVVLVDLTAPGLSFKLTPPGGTLDTVRQTTLDYLKQEKAQLAVNAHYFLPFPSPQADASLVGFAASGGKVFAPFEEPVQSYALLKYVPALNIDPRNQAGFVHHDPADPEHRRVLETVTIGNALSGSAQIVTKGEKTIPTYGDVAHPTGLLTPGGPNNYSNERSWYDAVNARTAIGLTRDGKTLVILVVDRAGGSQGMTVGEVADLLVRDYGVYDGLNLDGGGSSSLAMENPQTKAAEWVNVSSDNPAGRSVADSLAIFAWPAESAK
jgi:hypothetical protein